MPPKSNKKEEIKQLWYDCEKCGLKITQNQLKSKEECSGFGIEKNSFITKTIFNRLPTELNIRDTPHSYLERFIFIPESICNYCNFSMNSNLLIEINGEKYIKSSWTINNDKFIDRVYCISKEFQIDSKDVPIRITKFDGNIRIAQKITVKCSEIVQNINDIKRLIHAKLKNTIVCPSNAIHIEYLNKKFIFSIDSFEEKSENNVIDKFAQLNLNDEKYFLVQPETVVQILSKNGEIEIDEKQQCKLEDIGGLDEIIAELKRIIKVAFDPPSQLASKVSRGVLLHGLSGCGKTLLTEAMANSFKDISIVRIESWKVFSKFYGESELNLRKLFDEAFQNYPKPCLVIVDEISNLCPKNDSSDVVKKVSSLLISILDGLHQKRNGSRIFLIATTNHLDNVDPALRRYGRLEYDVEIPVPNTEMRKEILRKMLKNFDFNSVNIENLAKLTHGYVGADLEKLIGKSKRIENNVVLLSYDDILPNISSVKPSAMRELLIEKPNVKWSDIGGMSDLKMKLVQIVDWPMQYPETFKRLGIKPVRGLLMFGPPGCSKTMIAKALATESNLNFISIKGSDLFSMWVGESEKAVRDLFIKARQLAPCIIFFDEIDAIGGERESGSSVKERVLAQILTEIDGVNILKNVIIIAATNRPDLIDKALMRPGRLDRIVYVQLPDAETRREIFKIKLQTIPIAKDVDIGILVSKTEGYSGAEIEGVCKEAGLMALEESFDIQEISMSFFLKALEILKPRTSNELLEIYKEYEKKK